ncbi:hypothetical protein M407DRAFT_86553 [Tulasnella calospora MUT 4182]|uniref:Uncharacterized protein n=1 Tax=Tulasnella calospora MUT 4182 TaxID=1051891 RepID=A0A0C3Q0R4_9AGAM|nr:hypothetical protein M407DRAFT_86553 [Tulasnella calospora MUT 4182]
MRHYTQTGCLKRAKPGTTHSLRGSRQLGRPHRTHPITTPTELDNLPFSPRSNSPLLPNTSDAPQAGQPAHSTRRYPRVWVEEIADSGDFPTHLRVVDIHPTAGQPLGPEAFKTAWEERKEMENKAGNPPWMGFASEEEWDFAKFLMKSGLSQEKVNELLQLKITTTKTRLSFRNKYEFFKKVDNLPRGPQFGCETVMIVGDILDTRGKRMKEEAELWLRNPVEVVRELLGRPSLRNAIVYVPLRAYTGADRQSRIYDKMWTGDWWYDAQNKLPSGATIAPVILASDKTQLSTFGGDKTAYPVYLTLGNFAKAVRRQPSQRATVLLGYLPIPALACCSSTTRQLKNYEIFHTCMARLLEPLVAAGRKGVSMRCADGRKRLVFPLLAAYCADHPEQCVVACCPENRCPKGTVERDERGELKTCWGRDQELTLKSLQELTMARTQAERREALDQLKADGIRAVVEPFWKDLPHCDIFSSLMPDLLHQLHKGVFHAHLVAWCDSLMAPGELDRRFMSMASHPDLRHFSKGITTIKQWTGKEQRAMEKLFVGAVAGGVNDERVVIAARAMLDFIYLAQLPAHTSETLIQLDDCLRDFHRNKSIFLESGIRTHFNIPKLHALIHYSDSISSYGTADGYNTEYPERFHIEYAKLGYHASNKRDYQKQMVTWLERQEAVDFFDAYVRWAQGSASPLSSSGNIDHDNPDKVEEDEAIVVDSAPSPVPLYHRTTFRIAKKAPLAGISILSIREHFGVPDLVWSLSNYIAQVVAAHPNLRIQTGVSFHKTFDIYKRVVLLVPPASYGFDVPWEDRVRATPVRVPRVLPNLGAHAFFDTVLVKTPPSKSFTSILGQSSINLAGLFLGSRYRYQVARLRLIFELPRSVAVFQPQPTLAYIEWFSELKATHDASRMFEITKLVGKDGHPIGEVIPVSRIVRSCHLIPKWEDDLVAPVESVLDEFTTFFVNEFLDLHCYLSL